MLDLFAGCVAIVVCNLASSATAQSDGEWSSGTHKIVVDGVEREFNMLGYKTPRPAIGERATWAQHFKNAGYYTARVSKIFHMGVPPKIPGDWDDIPKLGINYKTSRNMKMNEIRQKKAVSGYFAAVRYMDRQVGKVLSALKEAGIEDETIVIFTSDHGYHLGEHDFWAKVSLHEESAKVPLIIRVPGKPPVVCDSLTELLDLYPTIASHPKTIHRNSYDYPWKSLI